MPLPLFRLLADSLTWHASFSRAPKPVGAGLSICVQTEPDCLSSSSSKHAA